MRAILLAAILVVSGSCGGGRPPVAIPPPAAPPAGTAIAPPAAGMAWTAIENKTVDTRVGILTIPFMFTRLDVFAGDSSVLAIMCGGCSPMVTGYTNGSDLVTDVYPPNVAAWGSLPEFLLSIRDAASRRDLDALLPVMAPDFSYDFIGIQSPDAAFAVWRAEDFRSLDEVPRLLDQGVTSDDRIVWVSPPAFLTDLSYRGPRVGFRRRSDGRWEWLFLIRGIS